MTVKVQLMVLNFLLIGV